MKKLLCTLGLSPLLLTVVSCGTAKATTTATAEEITATEEPVTTTVTETTTVTDTEEKNPKICITLSNDKTIKCELYPEVAPITVSNFLSLVDQSYYDGVVFHRVIADFMIQTGGYYLNGTTVYAKTSVPSITGEFTNNGHENNILHEAGVLSMARAQDYDSGSSQFFICVATCTWLDGDYAAFGKTLDEESLTNAIEISKTTTVNIGGGLTNFPSDGISIKTITRIKDSE